MSTESTTITSPAANTPNWTLRTREWLYHKLPPRYLLPDAQPDYVRSLVYLFGALAIGAFAFVIASGTILALVGPDWWHTSGVGHFVNSVHLWSVEIFFFFMVLHLWGMFFMGAWRDNRAKTWVVGAIAFVVSIGTAFTGYLSQTNFDSQWIGVSAKDAMNSAGIGGFFNVLDFGRMYGIHVLILPVVLLTIVILHLVLVRLRGVVRPYPVPGEQPVRYRSGMTQEEYYQGIRMAPYDLLREIIMAGAVVVVVAVVLALIFSSPDAHPLTLQSVAQSDPLGFTTVAVSELQGTSAVAQYGPPYNHGTGSVQYIGPFSPQELMGVSLPVDTAQVYVLSPLQTIQTPQVSTALRQFTSTSPTQQNSWETAYANALGKADGSLDASGHLKVANGDYGPLPVMFGSLLDIARSGALDGLLLTNKNGRFYETNYTLPLLFLNEQALPAQAAQLNLLGSQWGMTNETGLYPGQSWLWLYTFWYQLPFTPFNGPNADIFVLAVMAVLTLALILIPYIPGINDLPRRLGVYRLIWRDYYKQR